MNQSAGAGAGHTRRFSADEKDIDLGLNRNWKGIGISLLVIVLMLSVIGLSIVLLSKDDGSKSVGSQLTLDDIFNRHFQVHDPDAKWISDEEFIFQSWDGSVYKANAQHNQTQLLLKNTTFATFKASQFALSPDLNYVLLGYDVQQVFQHSFLASYLIYNLHTREVQELNPPEVSNSVLQFASWGVRDQQLRLQSQPLLFLAIGLLNCIIPILQPPYRWNSSIFEAERAIPLTSMSYMDYRKVYIFENNIYYQADVQSSSWRLTSSGQEGAVFNGISDWLYEEQVIHTQVAHWWSPDGSWLAYLSINDTLVPTMLLPHFTGGRSPRGKKYPYPKMGQINPTVKLYIIALDGGAQTAQLRPPHSFEEREHYITMVTWLTQQRVAVRWVNRAQNMSILTLCDVITAHCVKKHVMTSEKWIDRQNEEPVFSQDGMVFFITLPLKNSGGGAFNHIAMITNQSEDQEVNVRHLTSGGWEVSQVLTFDENTDSVYFLSTEDGFAQRQLYRVSTVSPFQRSCLSCSLSKVRCTHFHARLSPRCQHVLLDCRGPGIPSTTVHQLSDMTGNISVESNVVLAEALQYRTLPKRNRGTVHINHFGLHMELSLPAALDETIPHPLLLILNSAPGEQSVSDCFLLDWDSVLVSSDNVVVARLDGRGSGFQGQRVLHELHQHLGTMDVQDQIAAVEYLFQLPYIDRNRVGVYGKAYGGFLSTALLLSHQSPFRCAASVSPVINWRFYGSFFTERYFGFPAKEESQHQISSLLSNTTTPNHTMLLILHPTADATVHFQHSAELVKLMSSANLNYTLQIFPDEGHVIASDAGRRYMVSSLMSFFRKCFEEEEGFPAQPTN